MSDFGPGSAVWYAEKNLARAETQIAELEKQLHGTVTTKYHDKIVAEAMRRIAALEEAIKAHMRSFTNPDDYTEKDKTLWAAMEQGE